MQTVFKLLTAICLAYITWTPASAQLPPYPLPYDYMPGTFPFLIMETDPSAYTDLEYKRIENRVPGESYVFHARYADQAYVEVTVLTHEYSQNDASYYAEFFARMLGRLPVILRERVEGLELIRSDSGRGIMYVVSGTQTISIQITRSESQLEECFSAPGHGPFCPIEETLLHETGHIVQERIENSYEWREARNLDGSYISDYARRNDSEDIAESVVAWVGLQIPHRLYPTPAYGGSTQDFVNDIRSTIGHRLYVLDDLFLPAWNRSIGGASSNEIDQLNAEIDGLRRQVRNLEFDLEYSQGNDATELKAAFGFAAGLATNTITGRKDLLVGMVVAMLPNSNTYMRIRMMYHSWLGSSTWGDVANSLADTDAFQETYPVWLANREFVESFLDDVLGNNVSADVMAASVDAATNLLNDGMTRGHLVFEVVKILEEIDRRRRSSNLEDHPASEDLGMAAKAFIERIDAATGSARF